MAYSCVRVHFEIGHEAVLRSKRTPVGFTHDWEVFVRGADNAEIHHFVEKVVFHLHETFKNPKRVVKEPPYSVKESGYAGFNLPIDIYLKTKEEGFRKIRFYYDLTLQLADTGIAKFSNVVKEKSDFPNPPEDFRRMLIRGGGVGTSTSNKSSSSSNNVSHNSSNNVDDSKNLPHVPSKGFKNAAPSGDQYGPAKKYKTSTKETTRPEETRLTNSFAELFGTPIKTVKQSPNAKPPNKSGGGSESSKSGEKSSKEKVPKQSPAKEKGEKDKADKRDRDGTRESKKEKESRSNKEKDGHNKNDDRIVETKNKEKAKKSAFNMKDFIKKDDRKEETVKEKDRSSSKSSDSSNKSERKQEEKRSRSDEPKKDKHKKEHQERTKDVVKDVEKDRPVEKPKHDVVTKEVAKDKDASKHQAQQQPKVEKEEKKPKEKHSSEPEKVKHKHKKKDKHKKDEESGERSKKKDKDRDRDKEKEKRIEEATSAHNEAVPLKGKNSASAGGKEKEKQVQSVAHSPSPTRPPSGPPSSSTKSNNRGALDVLFEELTKKEESDSDFSGAEEAIPVKLEKREIPSPPSPPPPPPPVKVKSEPVVKELEKPEKSKKKEKKSKDDEHRKRKRKHKEKDSKDEPRDKTPKTSAVEPTVTPFLVNSIKEEKQSPRLAAADTTTSASMIASPLESRTPKSSPRSRSVSPLPPPSKSHRSRSRSRSRSPEDDSSANTLFTEEYINQLKDLQHKIMTLQDNADLQRVVQVITETGQFEITQRTFDFDLCALDPNTVKMLQNMFIPA